MDLSCEGPGLIARRFAANIIMPQMMKFAVYTNVI